MPRSKILWVLLPALLSLGPGALSPARAGVGPAAWAGGKVVDEAGRPVEGARVELLPLRTWARAREKGRPNVLQLIVQSDPAQAKDGLHQALSGPDGSFRISGLPADSWFSLRITQRGFTVLVERGIAIPPSGGQVALGTFRLPKVSTVAGRVVDSKGHPLAGAQIWALSAQDLDLREFPDEDLPIRDPEAPAAVTGPDGRFAIPRFKPGILEVCGKGLAPSRISPQPSGGNRIVLAPLPPSSRISGRVIDGQGLPVARAEVHLRAHGRDLWSALLQAQERKWDPCPPSPRLGGKAVLVYDEESLPVELVVLSDREGRFTAELIGPEATVDFRADAAGYLQKEGSRASLSPRSLGNVELVLERGAVVSGRVLTARGLPAAGAGIGIWGGRGENAAPVRTDAQGRYRVAGVDPGSREVVIQHPSGETRRQIEVVPGESRQPDLKLNDDAAREIRGRVTGPDGAGIPEASVTISFSPALHAWSDDAWSGPDGSFQLEFRSSLARGKTLAVDAGKPGYASRHLRLDPAAAVAAPLEIRLDPGARLTGHILGVDPESLPDVSVKAVQNGDRHPSPVGRDGEFRIAGLGPGEWAVAASLGNRCVAARVTLPPGAEETVLDLEIPSRVEVQGIVLAPDGTPVAGAQVGFRIAQESLACEEADSAVANSVDDGSFSIPILEGRYLLIGDARGYAPTIQKEPLTVARSPVKGLEVRLGSGVGLSGRFLGLAPDEVRWASVEATQGTVQRDARIAGDGTYHIDDLGPGDWAVQAKVQTEEITRRRVYPVKLKPGQAGATLDVDLLGELSLTLRFASRDGLDYEADLLEPGAGGAVLECSGATSASVVRFQRLPAGRYLLRITDDRHARTFERPVDLAADQEIAIDLVEKDP
jgi:hypothetical protein